MRPAQQNRRMRGRGNNNNNNNNNRKGPNPLSRNYESNGPDVKIRGNAQHVAEKYATLARDAQASGDRVMAENYLQHAEHYNRIIMAAMAQNPVPFQREESFDDDGMDDDDSGFSTAVAAEPRPVNGSGPQPVIEGTPAEVIYGEEGGENRQPRERDNNREGRDNRRPGRGRRPQRERFASEERTEDQPRDKAVQPAVEAPVAAVQEAAPVAPVPVPAPPPAPVAAAEAEPVKVTKAAKAAVEVPAEAKAEGEAAAPRPATRRPGRPRRVAKDEAASGETPAADPTPSDA